MCDLFEVGGMKVHEQRDALVRAIELAAPWLNGGPTLGAFGHAREDCALVHIDYVAGIDGALSVLLSAVGEADGTDAATVHKRFGLKEPLCDCSSCIGDEAAAEARQKHREAYTNVKEWVR